MVDANVLAVAADRGDPNHESCRNLLQEWRSQPTPSRQQHWDGPILLTSTSLPCEPGSATSHRPLVNKIGLGQSS